MSYPEDILRAVTADRLVIELSASGGIKYEGDEETVERWLPRLRQDKAEIVVLLKQLPRWCRPDCPHLETHILPGEGLMAGCVNPDDWRHWQRLDKITSCPARKRPSTNRSIDEVFYHG